MGSLGKVLSCEEARGIELLSLLSQLGFSADKIKGNDHWFKSPLRSERTASFKVDSKRNLWYDFGMGQGGNTIDFGILYFTCSVKEFLAYLSGLPSFPRQASVHYRQVEQHKPKLIVTGEKPVENRWLISYLAGRGIPSNLASRYCIELSYQIYGKPYYAVGFKNDSGGYEIRSRYFKGSSAPKDFTSFRYGATRLSVFEGFIDFLSFLQLPSTVSQGPSDFLVLNSLALLGRAASVMEPYDKIDLYLDQNTAGRNATVSLCRKGLQYQDRSAIYTGYEDLNDYLVGLPQQGTGSDPEIPP